MINVDEMIMDAIKSEDSVKLMVARLLKNEISKFKTAKNAKPYTEVEEINLIQKMITQREDSLEQYSKAGRFDLMIDEKNELMLLKTLIPEPVKESEIYDWLSVYCVEQGWQPLTIPKKFMGSVIKDAKAEFPTANGKMISEIVKENLE